MAHTGTVLVLRVVRVDGGSPALTFTFSSVSARVGGLFVLRLFRRHAKEGSKREELYKKTRSLKKSIERTRCMLLSAVVSSVNLYKRYIKTG